VTLNASPRQPLAAGEVAVTNKVIARQVYDQKSAIAANGRSAGIGN